MTLSIMVYTEKRWKGGISNPRRGLPRLRVGHILLQRHQLGKDNLAGHSSPADPDRNMPRLADLLNCAKDEGSSYKPGSSWHRKSGTKPSVGHHEKAHGLSGPPRASLDLPALGRLPTPSLCLEGESSKEKVIYS